MKRATGVWCLFASWTIPILSVCFSKLNVIGENEKLCTGKEK